VRQRLPAHRLAKKACTNHGEEVASFLSGFTFRFDVLPDQKKDRIMKKQTSSVQPTENTQKGFSLIELLVVVAVVMILAAIAIPNFIRSRMATNEASAVESLRNIATAQVVYSTTYGIGFASALPNLSGNGVLVDQNSAGLIDQVLATGLKSGYIFTLTVVATDSLGNVQAYSVTADPQVTGSTGQRHFYTDQTSVIRVNSAVTAGPGDPPIT
jgi:type IV pilus assembly protein PilA